MLSVFLWYSFLSLSLPAASVVLIESAHFETWFPGWLTLRVVWFPDVVINVESTCWSSLAVLGVLSDLYLLFFICASLSDLSVCFWVWGGVGLRCFRSKVFHWGLGFLLSCSCISSHYLRSRFLVSTSLGFICLSNYYDLTDNCFTCNFNLLLTVVHSFCSIDIYLQDLLRQTQQHPSWPSTLILTLLFS